MLKLVNIKKTYKMGDLETQALKGINLEFRKSEFVSILGPSGCGKTTMLNIIGGLDKYTEGDLLINDRSTKEYKDKDWDSYRNHSVGFVFQSYNLIPHQTVLENVELALTLSGVSKEERRKRATNVLKKVGLGDKLKNRPNQLSGGQMQRVAIARALVNDPEIILADEPTGALDTKSSVQIMELLKEISNDKLIIMVTHNPQLAEEYSTRIVNLLDGELTGDSNPYDSEKEDVEEKPLLSVAKDSELTKRELKKKNKKKKMSFFTALSLSLKNLLTKKARTALVIFAGSIGIIGIALVLAISSGFNAYVGQMQQDTLSTYPVTIKSNSYDMASLMQIFMGNDKDEVVADDGKVHTRNELNEMLSKFNASSAQNDLKPFKAYLQNEAKDEVSKYATAIKYDYNTQINAYYNSLTNGLIPTSTTTVFADIINAYPRSQLDTKDKQTRYGLLNMMFGSSSSYFSNTFWSEMLDNEKFVQSQYELVGENSKWASEYNEVMIVVDKSGKISDYTLYGLGLLDQSRLETLLDNYINGRDNEPNNETFDYQELLNLEYKVLLETDFYELQSDNTYLDIRTLKATDKDLYAQKLQNLYDTKGFVVKVAGIIKEKQNVKSFSLDTNVVYSHKLTEYVIEQNNNSQLMQLQKNSDKNILTNQDFDATTTKEMILSSLNYIDIASPSVIKIFPIDFESKGKISSLIDTYNNLQINSDNQNNVISYSDNVGTMMSTISTIISAITYVLIAFVSVSLVVSSIMIGIITYISVIERTKEIGVLRSVGASKKDVSRVFTAESFIIGLSSGVLGIAISLLLILPINAILFTYTQISGLASLPIVGALILVAISVVLTLLAGLFPSKVAAKKDPVVALREN